MITQAAGNRRGKLYEYVKHAVCARPELNPQLHHKGPYLYMVTKEGKQVYLSNSLEEHQFALGLSCNGWHVRYATLHSITSEGDLDCQWCLCWDDSWEGKGKEKVSEAEKEAMLAVMQAKLDHTTACQVLLPFWEGRVDFYHITSKTSMQHDGSSHFESMHHRAPQIQLLNDIECCSRAWSQGYRLLRVHHKCARCEEAMIVATQQPYARFVMLAGRYDRVVVWYEGRHISYIELLQSMLKGARYLQMAIPDSVIFY
jgi:very-short-patch-repair endonuclease